MGNTSASTHIAWRGSVDDAAKAISRCYSKLGYKRVKKAPAEGGKHVVLLARAGQSYVSVYDSDNAKLDSGELKDMARAASKALKTAAVFTSLYDSDSYEFIVFANGRQVDLLMTDDESYDGPMKRLSDKSRAAKWGSLFGRTLSIDQIQQAVTQQTPFADHVIAGLSKLIGLCDGQSQINYQDFLDQEEEITAEFYFKRKPMALSDIPAGQILLRDYFDPDNCRMRAVYPASWPIPIGTKRLATWLILSQGAGFSGGTATVSLSGPDTMILSKAIISGCKFHNGQIVGSLEPVTPNLTQEDVAKLVDAKRFKLMPVETSSAQPATYSGEFPHLIIPSMTPERTTQILLILQMDLEAPTAGEWEINVSLQPGTQTEYQHKLPPLRIAAIEQKWIPVISGLNPKTTYDKSNLSATHLRELNYTQSRIPGERRLDHPAVTSSVAILKDEGQPTLDACKTWLEAWLRPLSDQQEGEITIHAEKQMTESAHVGKTKKKLPVSGFLNDRIWGKLFDGANDYQTVLVTYVPKDAECAIAGIGLQHSFKEGEKWKQDHDIRIADTLGVMRGRPFDILALGGTWHVFKWVINHEDCYKYLGTSALDMEQQMDSFAAGRLPLQAWSSQCTWIPAFDYAGSYERTVYEETSLLNWFRGILSDGGGLNGEKMTAQWCGHVLRMVTQRLWLCRNLIDQVNRAALERVAQVSETNGVYKIALRPECTLDELELALLPILPVESARISVL
jgi:hypothetical protein